MSWSPGEGVEVSIGLGVGYKEPINLMVNRADHVGYLTIGKVAEIKLEPGHLESLWEQLPDVLADLEVMAAAVGRAASAGGRANELERYLRDEAAVADRAGDPERAAACRLVADTLNAARSGLDSALEAVDNAARLADDASEDAKKLLDRPDDPEAA